MKGKTMNQEAVKMDVGEFADWAVGRFGVDYDSVMFWDMLRDLDSGKRMPEGFEVSQNGKIPAELYDILMARKEGRVTRQSGNIPTPVRLSEWEQRDGTAE